MGFSTAMNPQNLTEKVVFLALEGSACFYPNTPIMRKTPKKLTLPRGHAQTTPQEGSHENEDRNPHGKNEGLRHEVEEAAEQSRKDNLNMTKRIEKKQIRTQHAPDKHKHKNKKSTNRKDNQSKNAKH